MPFGKPCAESWPGSELRRQFEFCTFWEEETEVLSGNQNIVGFFQREKDVMAIEFRCQQCNTLLRIADGTTGRQAKCPECGTMMTVPAPASDMPASGVPGESPPSYPPPPPPPSQGEDPFSSGQERPAGQESQWNPYQSPGPSAQAPWQA